MNVTLPTYGTMPLQTQPLSIFDHSCAGQLDINDDYYVICINHKTHELYAVSKEGWHTFYKSGRPLEPGETGSFFGERVRAMTFREEMAYNEDRLLEHVDLWGNIAEDELFDMEWYMEHCL